ncbi:MAG: NADH-quinone oxidoreductase subunit [Actinomycetota bacterium]|jgi:NADH-quinone oxidoreductase subunit L|nr:NADH-quinone oxidoreductase subunit [Actinomycetota bacterium]
MTEYMWLVPLLPVLSFFAILFFGKKTKSRGHWFGIGALGIGFAMSLFAFIQLAAGNAAVEKSWNWFKIGDTINLEFGMHYDFLTGVMFVVVTLIALLVHIYSTGYMHDDERYTIFFAFLSLFTGSMLFMVIANNLLQLFVGWELVGVCSYFLIGHYWEEKENSSAAMKAFITNRVGDMAFLFGIFVLFFAGHGFNIEALNHAVHEGHLGGTVLTVGALLLFGGVISKSAQFPLYVWLPDAMAGPTPVSALIHAATMVVAGVYLVARMFLLFEGAGSALQVVSVVAAITMLLAAILALVQDDIKRVLAYSTISQLAYMVAALGVGAYTAGVFHLFTHAMFKALLFLGAGSLIHSAHTNNMSEMGGMRKYMPHTFRTFMIGSLGLAGIFPLAGFFSKDEIIGGALRSASEGRQLTSWIVLISAILTAFLTALYVTRMLVKTFWGEYKGHGTPHESPGSMVTPLWILAGATITVGFLGFPVIGPFKEWINVPGEVHHGFETLYNIILPVGATVVALAAIGLGIRLFHKPRKEIDIVSGPFGWMYRFVENKYYLDDFYLKGIVKPIQYPIARATYWTSQKIFDGAVNSAGRGAVALSRPVYDILDQQVIDFAVNGAAGLTGYSGGLLKYIQSGNVQRYAAVLFGAIALFVAAFVLL